MKGNSHCIRSSEGASKSMLNFLADCEQYRKEFKPILFLLMINVKLHLTIQMGQFLHYLAQCFNPYDDANKTFMAVRKYNEKIVIICHQ